MFPNKSITFDKKAQDNLPQHIKDKMKKQREESRIETMKLIPMSDFVLGQKEKLTDVYSNAKDPLEIDKARINFIHSVSNYANFLKQTILIGMLVPCDEKGMEIIIDTEHREDYKSWSIDEIEQYKKAESEIYLKTTIDLETAKFHVKQKRTIEYFTSFDIEISDYAITKFQLKP